MSGGGLGAAAVIVASARWSDAVGLDTTPADTRGASFADGPVGGVAGCGDATGASGTASAGVAGTACGVVDKDVSALVSASAVLMRHHRLGNIAAGSVMPASGDMT